MKQEARLFPRKPFYLVRHGESFANKFEYPSGSMDTRLTRLGWAQALATAAVAARLTIKPGVIVASQLVRARETATLIHAHMECSLKTDRYLAEQHYGGYQGVSKHRIVAQHGHEIWWKTPQDGESLALFSSRVMGCMGRWLNRYEYPMFVAHGGLFTAFGDSYGSFLRGIPNAGIFLFEPVRKGWNLSRIENINGADKTVLYCQL